MNQIKLNKKKIEKILNVEFNDYVSLGIDTATKSGWCRSYCTRDILFLDFDIVDTTVKKKKNEKITEADSRERYIKIYRAFKDLIEKTDVVTIENSFMFKNFKTSQMLDRINFIPFLIALLNGNIVDYVSAKTPKSVKYFGIATKNKEEYQKIFLEKLEIDLTDNDIIDAIIISLYGLIKKDNI